MWVVEGPLAASNQYRGCASELLGICRRLKTSDNPDKFQLSVFFCEVTIDLPPIVL